MRLLQVQARNLLLSRRLPLCSAAVTPIAAGRLSQASDGVLDDRENFASLLPSTRNDAGPAFGQRLERGAPVSRGGAEYLNLEVI